MNKSKSRLHSSILSIILCLIKSGKNFKLAFKKLRYYLEDLDKTRRSISIPKTINLQEEPLQLKNV